MNADCQEELVRRLVDKIRKNADDIIEFEEEQTEGADVVVVSYGITSRVALRAVDLAREEGIKVGILRLIVVWPFPEKRVRELARQVKSFVVPEINYGQVAYEVDRCAGGQAEVALSAHGGGWVHNPESILYTIRQAAQGKRAGEGIVEYHRKKRG